jgi:hypothetical protein
MTFSRDSHSELIQPTYSQAFQGLYLGSLFLFFHTTPKCDKAWRNPTSNELNHLFEWVTRDFPNQMLLVSETHIDEPPLSQNEILEIYEQSSTSNTAQYEGLSTAEEKALKEQNLLSLQRRFSGKRKLSHREWYSRFGKLYRIDSLDHQSLFEDSILRTNIESGKIEYHYTKVGINDLEFLRNTKHPKARRLRVNHGIGSGSIRTTTSPWDDEPQFWQALTLEPELAFPIASLLMATNTIPSSPTFRESMSGLKANQDRIREAAAGQIKGWTFVARQESLDGEPVTRLKVKGEQKSLFTQVLNELVRQQPLPSLKQDLRDASRAEFSYWMDHHDPPRLLRAEKTIPGKSRYVSMKNNFNDSGFPLLWQTNIENLEKKTVTSTTRQFSTADLNPNFQDTDAFGLNLLDSLILVGMDGELIEDRSGFDPRFIIHTKPTNPNQTQPRHWMTRTLFLLFLLFPGWLVFKWKMNKG